METGLMNKTGKIIECPYYEIENLCKKIIEEYCSRSEENNQKYVEFAKDYTIFSPYFDFAIGILGYSLINPFFCPKTILSGNEEHRGFCKKGYSTLLDDYVSTNYNGEYFHFSSDKDLQIRPFVQKEIFYETFITPNLMEITPVINSQEFARQILHLGMIKSKSLCVEIQAIHQEEIDYVEILLRYFSLLQLGFQPTAKKNYLFFRSDNITFEQSILCKSITEKSQDMIVMDKKDLHKPKNWSHKFMNEENIIYLNKR